MAALRSPIMGITTRLAVCPLAVIAAQAQTIERLDGSKIRAAEVDATVTRFMKAVMMLIEEGKIALDDPVTKYLNDAPVTWRQSHQAGSEE
jgi:Beta-lactamase